MVNYEAARAMVLVIWIIYRPVGFCCKFGEEVVFAGHEMEAESSSERTNSVPTEPSFLDTPQDRRLAYHRTHGDQPGVVYIHGLNSDMEGEKCVAVDSYCRSRGRAFVRFDLSGHGRSSGSLRESTVTAWLEDVCAVLEHLTDGPQVAHTHTHTHISHSLILHTHTLALTHTLI